jgi:uncharacterized protein CbrC (UPF0167 family)
MRLGNFNMLRVAVYLLAAIACFGEIVCPCAVKAQTYIYTGATLQASSNNAAICPPTVGNISITLNLSSGQPAIATVNGYSMTQNTISYTNQNFTVQNNGQVAIADLLVTNTGSPQILATDIVFLL